MAIVPAELCLDELPRVYFMCKPALSFIQWTSFNALSKIYFLRVSYIVLVGVPMLAAYQRTPIGQYFVDVPLTLKLGYFASLLISLAHMIYQGYCPQVIKRFESPNDLYRDMLEIKALQSQYLPEDANFRFDINHCRDGYTLANHKNWFARLVCAVFYGLGVILVTWVIVERTVSVFNA